MLISFNQLIKVAPFDEQTRNKIRDKLPSLTEDQKFELTQVAWKLIAVIHHARLKERVDLLLKEIAEGKRPHNPNDFIEAEAQLYQELASNLDVAEKEEGLKEVREELNKYSPKAN